MRNALRHPFGLTLLVATIVLAGGMRFLPALERSLERWSGQALWILLWGLAVYAVAVVALRLSRPAPSAPELRQLEAIRRMMQARLTERRTAEGGTSSELTHVLADAIAQLDRQVRPALQQLLERQGELTDHLAHYDAGTLPLPEPVVLDRLRAIYDRQRAAIEECVQQASNAGGTLAALLQDGDDANVATRARAWAGDLLNLYDAIGEVLRGDRASDELGRLYEHGAGRPSVPGAAPNSLQADDRGHGASEENLLPLVQEALRHVNSPSVLSDCALARCIPHTLAVASSAGDGGLVGQPMPLDEAQALRSALVATIERLRPPREGVRPEAPEAHQYHILHDAYVLGRATSSIMVRHAISESTFHRHRREAVAAAARHLETQEGLLERRQSSH